MTQLHRTPGAVLPPAARWRRVLAVVDASGLVPIVDHTLTAGVGRPRTFGARALLACLLSHGFSGRDMLFTRVTDTAASLTPEQLHDLDLDGLPVYHLIWEAFTKVCDVLRNGGLPVPGGGVLSAAQFADRLIAASIPALYTLTTSVALDGTDFETWAKRMSWAEFVSAAGTSVPEGTVIIPGKHIPTAGWPKQGTGLDTRLQHSKDPDARDGVRSGHNLSPKNVYNGFEAHLATQIPNPGGAPVPHLVTGMTLSPAGTHRGPPGVRTIESILNRGQVITDVCADRGYTPLRPETFVLPLWSRGVDVWGDLTQQQRGQRPGPIPGTLWIDGALYTSAIPEGLRHFQPPAMNANSEDRRQIHEQFDRRRPYMFTPLTARDPAGYQRFKGPALAGKVRCPNNPRHYGCPTTGPPPTAPSVSAPAPDPSRSAPTRCPANVNPNRGGQPPGPPATSAAAASNPSTPN